MQSTDIPLKLPIPFANSAGTGYKRAIPLASQIGVTDGAASLTDGFVPLNATPVSAGGKPPDVKDMNGILYEMSAWTRWAASSGPVFYDAAFSAAVGGYPRGATIASSTVAGAIFVSLTENNVTNPDSGDASWQRIGPQEASAADVTGRTRGDVYISPRRLGGVVQLVASSYGPNGYRIWGDGLIEQWGHVTAYVGTEITIPASFNVTYPTAVDNIIVTPYIPNPSNRADGFLQVVESSKSTAGFSVQVQAEHDSFAPLSGFDWSSKGR